MIGLVKNIERKYETLFGDIYTENKTLYRIMAQKYDRDTKLYELLKNGDYVHFASYANMRATEIEYILEKDNNKVKYNRIDEFKSLTGTTSGATVVLKDFKVVVEASYDRKDYNERDSFCYQIAYEQLMKKAKKLGGNATINSTMEQDLVWKGPVGKNLVAVFKVSGTVAIIGKPSFEGLYTRDELIALHLSDIPRINSFINKLKLFFKFK